MRTGILPPLLFISTQSAVCLTFDGWPTLRQERQGPRGDCGHGRPRRPRSCVVHSHGRFFGPNDDAVPPLPLPSTPLIYPARSSHRCSLGGVGGGGRGAAIVDRNRPQVRGGGRRTPPERACGRCRRIKATSVFSNSSAPSLIEIDVSEILEGYWREESLCGSFGALSGEFGFKSCDEDSEW